MKITWPVSESGEPCVWHAVQLVAMNIEANAQQPARVGILAEAETSIPERFAQIAALYPSRTALVGATWQPTYAKLDLATNRLANIVVSHGGSFGDRVALLVRQDAPLIAAALAVLKAGRIVVVLNPTDPPARLQQILDDVEPCLMVTDSANHNLAAQTANKNHALICLEEQNSEPAHPLEIKLVPDSAAWLIYTSGSTGRPKGVILTHRNIIHNVWRHGLGMNVTAADRLVLLSSPGGGQGVATTWCALLNGAALYPFPTAEKGVTGLKEWMTNHKITVYVSSPSIFRQFTKTLNGADFFPDVRLVRFGADTATAHEFAAYLKFFPEKCVLLNSLSSSETGNMAQQRFTHDSKIADGRLPVGWPADGIEILLLDQNGREVCNGEIGEITVRSHYLSPGYWRNETLTAARFSQDKTNGVRAFRSGDLGRRTAEGALVFMDRKDTQIKIHGYRIEISEIENILLEQPEVQAAAVSARKEASEDTQLVAHIVVHADQNANAETLRCALRKTLPGHMVPAHFIFHDKLPLTSNGKIDREKLRHINPPVPAQPAAEEMMTATEALLAGIWKKVFNRGSVGRHDDFVGLGGDSLMAAVVAAEIYAALKLEIELRVFNDHSTLAGLAGAIDRLLPEGRINNSPCFSRASRDAPLPLSFTQEDVWKCSQNTEGMLGYTMASSHLIRGPLNVCALQESMSYLARRHEILRTTFDEIGGRLAQIVHPPEQVALPLLDFTGLSDAEAKAEDIFQKEAAQLFDLKRMPLMCFTLIRVRENEHWLLRVNHHIISDAWSWIIYFRELGLVYEAKLRGEAPPLPEFEPFQYGDYAAEQRRALDFTSRTCQEMVEWWSHLHSENLPPLKLPFRRLWRSRHACPADGLIWWGVDPAISQRLENLAREEGATYYVIRLAALIALLANKAGQHDVVLGTYFSGRNRVEWQNMFGDFSNQAILRLRCDPKQTFREWLPKVRKMVGEAQAHAEIPSKRLREQLLRRGVRPPDIRVIFTVSEHTGPVRFGGLEVVWLKRRMEGMPWGFSVTLDQHNEEHSCRVSFDARIYEPSRVRKWLDRFVRLLHAVSHNPDLSVGKLLAISK
jgi:amino acid adenylation domain-containing protein